MWGRLDDGWWCHPKVMGLSLAARGLWVSALSWSCAQRSSVVPATFPAMVGATPDLCAELADAGLWDATDGGWGIHDWSEYQELTTSERRAEAGRKGGRRSGEARRSKAKQTDPVTRGNGEANPNQAEASAEAGTHPIPTRPNPLSAADGQPPSVAVSASSPVVVDDQSIRAAAVAVSRAIDPPPNADPSAYAAGIARRILTGDDPTDRQRIEVELRSGRTVDEIAAAWTTEARSWLDEVLPTGPTAPDPMARPRLPEFTGHGGPVAGPDPLTALRAARAEAAS